VTYTHVLLDLDGTVYIGPSVVPGAGEAVRRLRDAGIRVAFLTNDPMSSRDDYVRRLAPDGIAVRAGDVVTSAWATAQLVARDRPGARVLALGSPAWRDEHRRAGLELVDEPGEADVLSVGGDEQFGYAHLRAAVRAVHGGAAFYGANRDRTFPDAGGPSPATGTVVAAIEYATGTTARCAGKPEPGMFDEARRLLGPGTYLMCGDRLDADVAGGARTGMDTALVLTGSASRRELEAWPAEPPTHVLASIADLPAVCGVAPDDAGGELTAAREWL
jgi:HAD superfamily hydrolase (TIGR01450 family)